MDSNWSLGKKEITYVNFNDNINMTVGWIKYWFGRKKNRDMLTRGVNFVFMKEIFDQLV